LLREVIAPHLSADLAGLPILMFSAAKTEQDLLEPYFAHRISVSLFGKYGPHHKSGVDARCLTEFAPSTYAAHYSCLLFDYFPEHDRALAEAYRVLAPGGVFFSHIQRRCLTETRLPPRVLSTIRPRPGYYDYIPSDQHMLNTVVGAYWFVDKMKASGFSALRYRVGDPSGIICDWFVGWKRSTG
jgi:SAM-dependent methyltransferase